MGKKTLYHPVSLNVIRGAAEFCGVKITRIRQTSISPDDHTAYYSAHVEFERINGKRITSQWSISPRQATDYLKSCFASDITAYDVSWSMRHGWVVLLQTKLTPETDAEQTEELKQIPF